MDIGSYCIHFLASLFGKPEKILADSLFLENGVDGAGSVITSYGDKQAEIIYSKITDSKLPTQIQGENGCMIIEQCPIIKKITIYYRNGETEELQFDKRDNPMIYETKDFINYTYTGIFLSPDCDLDKDGVYSGSAFVEDDTMYLYYTGNTMEDGDFDFTYEGRGSNTTLVTSKDGITASAKKNAFSRKS